MNLAPAETLLGALLAAANGIEATAGAEPARRTLAARGHPLVEASGRLTLACAAQHFDPRRFAAAQRGRFGATLEVWETLGSTNARAWEVAREGGAAGLVVVAEMQIAGRGRQGRVWDCPAHAGLLFSLLLPGALERSARPQLLPLALAVGVAEALRRVSDRDVRLKWPNDLVRIGTAPEELSAPRKLGGILLEAHAGPPACVVAGCGINVGVAPQFFAVHGLQAASVFDAVDSPRPRREEILADVLAAMEQQFAAWEAARWSDVQSAWDALDTLRGRDVEIECGAERWRGRARGITPHGLLELELADGDRRSFAAGEVHVR